MTDVRKSPSGPLIDVEGGDIAPLSTALVVDPEASGGSPDGSWSGTQAFPTLTEGVAELPTDQRASLYLCVSAEYVNEDPITLTTGCQLIGLTSYGSLINSNTIELPVLNWSNGVAQLVGLQNLVVADLSGTQPWAFHLNNAGAGTSDPACTATFSGINSSFGGFCGSAEMLYSRASSITAVDFLRFENCTLAGELQVTAGDLTILDCVLDSTLTIGASNITIDGTSGSAFGSVTATSLVILNRTTVNGNLFTSTLIAFESFLTPTDFQFNVAEFEGCIISTNGGTFTVLTTGQTITFRNCTFIGPTNFVLPNGEGDETILNFDLQSWESFIDSGSTITGEERCVVQGMLSRTLTVTGAAVPDDGDPHSVLSNQYPAFEMQTGFQATATIGLTIVPDNPATTPNGIVRIVDPDGGSSEIAWGPIPTDDSVYVPFSHFADYTSVDNDWSIQVEVEVGTGDVTCNQVFLKVSPSEAAVG